MRIEFMNGDGSVAHEIAADSVIEYKLSGKKLISNDFFMNEPASVRLSIVTDLWLAERWETGLVKLNDSLWFELGVRVYHENALSGYEELILSGLLLLTESEQDPFAHLMQIAIYDFTALLSELKVAVRFYYPWQPDTGTSFDSFIINYALPGEAAAAEPEEDSNLPWFPYPHLISTPDRQVSSVLIALSQIWQELYGTHWQLSFNHEYSSGEGGGSQVNNQIVVLADTDDFYYSFVQGLVSSAYRSLMNLTGASYYCFFANYGLLGVDQRQQLWREFQLLPPVTDCDAYFVMRAGYEYVLGSKDQEYNPHGGWTDGEGGGGGGTIYHREWYIIFALKDGLCVYSSGQRNSGVVRGRNVGQYVGSQELSPSTELLIGADKRYRCTPNDFYNIPPAYQDADIMEYFYSLAYYVYYSGFMADSGSWIGNRIFRMKTRPGQPGQEQYLELDLRDWFKTMFFIGDLSCYADESGMITFAPRLPADTIELPLTKLTKLKKKLLVYQPWDKEKLQGVINDNAEISYLIDYYGGNRVLTHELNLSFAHGGWTSPPSLRQRFVLPGSIAGVAAFNEGAAYMIVEIGFEGQHVLNMRAVRCS